MAGYSGTPLAKKLNIKESARLALIGEPEGFLDALGDLPPGVALIPGDERADVVVCFVRGLDEVVVRMDELKPRLEWTGGLWFAWQKRRPGFTPPLDENTIREAGLASGLVDNKVCVIDDEWSGLRFVWRLEDRPAAARRR